MNNEKLQAAKDQAAREIEGYYGKWRDWHHLVVEGDMNEIEAVINRAMEIYADMVNNEAKEALTVCWKSLCTYGKHPIIEIQVNNILKTTKP